MILNRNTYVPAILLIAIALSFSHFKLYGQGSGQKQVKIKTRLESKAGWFLMPLKIQEEPEIITELGKVWTCKTSTGIAIGISEYQTDNGKFLIYYDIDNDDTPDKSTMLKASSEEDVTITVRAPEHWTDADSADYILRVVSTNNGERPRTFIRPGYIRSGHFRSGKNDYYIKLYDLDCNGRYTIRESINGTTFAVCDKDGQNSQWQRIFGIINIGNKKYKCTEISPDGSEITLETYKEEDYISNERFSALDKRDSEIYPLKLSDKDYTLFEFWFTRCAVCIRKMPELVSWYDKNKNLVEIQGICVDYEDNYARARQIIEKYKITWDQKYIDYEDPFWISAGELAQKSKYSFPLYVLVNKKGQIETVQEGNIDFEEIEKIIQ